MPVKETEAASLADRPRPGLSLVVDGSARVGPILGIPVVLREMGLDLTEMAARAGVDAGLFDDADNTIPFESMGRLFRECVARSACPHFGLLVGERSAATSLGIVSELMQHAPDVGTALRDLVLYLQLQDRGAVPILEVHDDMVLLGYAVYQKGVVATDQIHDAAIAIGCNIMRALCGSGFQASEILLRRREPLDRTPYRRFFNAPVLFDSDQSALVFPKTWLEKPVRGADARRYQALQIDARAMIERSGVDFVDQMRRVLHGQMIAGYQSAAQVAYLFGMTPRTLNRRLADHGTTFRALLQEVRFESAQQLLRDTGTPLLRISMALGYANPSVFTRAFQRWSGQAPAAWRAASSESSSADRATE